MRQRGTGGGGGTVWVRDSSTYRLSVLSNPSRGVGRRDAQLLRQGWLARVEVREKICRPRADLFDGLRLAACAALFVARPEHALQHLASHLASAANRMSAFGMQREVLLKFAGDCLSALNAFAADADGSWSRYCNSASLSFLYV